MRVFSSCIEQGLLCIVVGGLEATSAIAVASLGGKPGLSTHGFSSCSSWTLDGGLSSSGIWA